MDVLRDLISDTPSKVTIGSPSYGNTKSRMEKSPHLWWKNVRVVPGEMPSTKTMLTWLTRSKRCRFWHILPTFMVPGKMPFRDFQGIIFVTPRVVPWTRKANWSMVVCYSMSLCCPAMFSAFCPGNFGMWTTELGLKPCKQWRLNMIKPTEKRGHHRPTGIFSDTIKIRHSPSIILQAEAWKCLWPIIDLCFGHLETIKVHLAFMALFLEDGKDFTHRENALFLWATFSKWFLALPCKMHYG